MTDNPASEIAEIRARLRELLHYDAHTGVFTRRVSAGNARAGTVAGATQRRQRTTYRNISIDHRTYYAHRLAWLYVYGEWPADEIDHINGVGSDNRLCNLRLATPTQNNRNARTPVTNTSGFKGVVWFKETKRWRAQINVSGRYLHIGYFDTKEAAHAAYMVAAQKHFGQFARMA